MYTLNWFVTIISGVLSVWLGVLKLIDKRKEKNKKKENLDRAIEALSSLKEELIDKEKKFGEADGYTKREAAVTSPIESVYYSANLFEEISNILKEHSYFEEIKNVDLLRGKINEDYINHKHLVWEAYAREINNLIKKLKEIKNKDQKH